MIRYYFRGCPVILVRGVDEDELANDVDDERSNEQYEQSLPSSKDPSSFDMSSSTGGSRRYYRDTVIPKREGLCRTWPAITCTALTSHHSPHYTIIDLQLDKPPFICADLSMLPYYCKYQIQ